MNQLVLVEFSGAFYAESRQVAEMVDKQHNHLLRDIENYKRVMDTNPTLDSAKFFVESSYLDGNGQRRKSFLITRRGCDMVANKMIGDKGILFTAEYVSKFEEMERKLATPSIPQTLPEALRLAADLAEQNERLLLKAEADRPKVIFAEALETSGTSILIGELAKILKQNGIDIGQNRLFTILRNEGYLGKRGEYWNIPTQRSMELKLFEIVTRSLNNPDGSVRTTRTTKVTGKGQSYFINKLKGRMAG